MISVIIPSYNDAETIGDTIQSVLECEMAGEIIVVDDCSTDDSCRVISEYPVKLIELEKNSGPSVARNIGACHAKGDVLVFVDSDVIVPKETMRELTKDYFFSSAISARPCAKPSFDNLCSKHFNWRVAYNYRGLFGKSVDFIYGSCFTIFKKDFIDIGGFNQNLNNCAIEDNELGMRLVNRGHILTISKGSIIHKKKIGFFGLLRNDFKRTVARVHLLLNMKRMGKVIASGRFISTPLSQIVQPLLILAFLFNHWFIIPWALLQIPYGLFVVSQKESTRKDCFLISYLIFIDMFIVLLGLIWGFITYATLPSVRTVSVE